MVRTQIQLPAEMHKRLRLLAAERGKSMSGIIREMVEDGLKKPQGLTRAELFKRSLEAVGSLRGGASDVSERHDDYLAEIYKSW